MGHIVLLGDSTLNNATDVAPGQSLPELLLGVLPSSWQVTTLAVDSMYTQISSLEKQTANMPSDATHLVISAGRNDCNEFLANNEDAESVRSFLDQLGSYYFVKLQQLLKTLEHAQQIVPAVYVCTAWDFTADTAVRGIVATFNDLIVRAALATDVGIVDLRLICVEHGDLTHPVPSKPSAQGAAKIATAIRDAVFK